MMPPSIDHQNKQFEELMNVLRPNYEHIPTELKSRNQWVCWVLKKIESPNGKPPKKPSTKVPICPLNGKNASTINPHTWTDFGTAWSYYVAFGDDGSVHGLGYILHDDLIGVDLDGCRDISTGQIAEWATAIINLLNSYTEISPSGSGIRIFCKGQPQPKGSNRRKGDIEIYDRNSPRYLTITGSHLDGTPIAIEPRQTELEQLYGQVFGRDELEPSAVAPPPAVKVVAPNPAPPSLEKVLAVAKSARNGEKFTKLWQGNWAGDYPSQSEADLALASMLGFYTGPDEELLDELFRQSGLYRDKWERDDYRESVLAKALDRDDFYSWGVSSAIEELAATTARKIAVPSAYRKLRNPITPSTANIRAGMEHFADHCATCHSNDGGGQTLFGKGLYPKPPDMRAAGTQNRSDGELYYTIDNGVRLSGMPAFSGAHTAEMTWRLVLFIRHLPQITAEELNEMKGWGGTRRMRRIQRISERRN